MEITLYNSDCKSQRFVVRIGSKNLSKGTELLGTKHLVWHFPWLFYLPANMYGLLINMSYSAGKERGQHPGLAV